MMSNIIADEILAKNITLRQKMMVAHLDDHGEPLTAIDNQEMLLKILDSTDRVIIANKRIKVEEKSANNAEKTNEMIAAVLKGVHGQRVFEIEQDITATLGTIPTPTEPLIDNVTLVDGELEIGIKDGDFNTFSKQYIDETA